MYGDILIIMKKLGGSFIKRLFRNENIETRLFKKTDFSFIIERDIELINDILLPNDIKKIDFELLCNFFKYPDIKDFIEKIYAPNQSDPLVFLVINIYSEFDHLVIKYFKLENDKARNFSTKLFDILIEGCNETLKNLINDGEIQSQNASYSYNYFRIQYSKIREIYQSLNNYKSIPDYLSRKVCSAEDYYSSSFLFSSGSLESIFQAIAKNKHISLLSDGGMGKTTELKQIAYHYSQSSDTYYPIFVSLNKYTTKNISEYFPSYWEFIPKNELLVILDGFDEIQSKKRLDAIREIEQFAYDYPDIHIIVSCRNNLYSIGTENISASLSGFNSYILVELEHDEIEGYVKNKVSSKSEFFASIYRHNLYDLLKNPFYLIHLAEHFNKNHVLPTSKAEIFRALLNSRIQFDVAHYRTTRELDEDKDKIIDTLEIIALSMECLSRNYITDDEFKQLLPETSSRELIKYCTTWKKQEKDDVTWQFEHNNFQEYLAAKKLSTLPLEIIKKYITFEPDYHKIIPSWINTISFLINLYGNQDLLKWILMIDPKLCIKFEFDKIDMSKRIQIFKEIFGEYEAKRILIGGVWFEPHELAKFGQSDEVIDFLLIEAESSVHYTTIVNSIELLCDLEIPFTKRDKIKEFLVKYALDDNCPELVQNHALRCLSIHKFDSKETINQIIPILKLSENERIRSGLYYFLSNSDSLDEYIDVFLYGVNLALDRDVFSDSEFMYLLKGLNNTKSPESIKKILTFFTNDIEYLDKLYIQNDIGFLSNSADAYLEDSSILDLYLELLKVLLLEYHVDSAKKLLYFFEKTSTRQHAFQKVYSNRNKETNPFTILAYLADLSCLELIIEEHKEDKITENEMWNFKHSLKFANEEVSILFNDLINENFGNQFISPQDENNGNEKRSVPKYIDLLFDKKLFTKEIERLFEIDSRQEFTCKELILLKIEHPNQYFSELVIQTLLKIAGDATVTLEKSLKYINNLNWDSFCTNNIYNKLERGEEINLSEEQKKIISDWCISNLANIGFKKSITKTDQQISANPTAIILWYFFRQLNIQYPKSTLLDMISFDWFEKGDLVGIEYLEMKLDFQDMQKRVLENLNEGIELNFILSNHIKYCRKHKIKHILNYSLDIIVDKNRDYDTRKLALDTTFEMLHTFSDLEELLPKIQDEFKWTVLRELKDRNANSCESYLLHNIDNGNEEDQLKAARYLMELQNLKGIEFFVNYMSEHNKYPYYINESPLRKLYSSEFIPYLLELLKISYQEDLVQDHFHSLHRDVLEAFSNVALRSEDDFIEVKRYIEKFIDEHSAEIKDVNFLYSNLENLEFKYYMSKNENINLDIVIEKLKEHGIY